MVKIWDINITEVTRELFPPTKGEWHGFAVDNSFHLSPSFMDNKGSMRQEIISFLCHERLIDLTNSIILFRLVYDFMDNLSLAKTEGNEEKVPTDCLCLCKWRHSLEGMILFTQLYLALYSLFNTSTHKHSSLLSVPFQFLHCLYSRRRVHWIIKVITNALMDVIKLQLLLLKHELGNPLCWTASQMV